MHVNLKINILSIIFSKFKFVITMPFLEDQMSKNEDNYVYVDQMNPKLSKFKMTKKEIKKFSRSIEKIERMNNCLIKHIKNLYHANEYNNFCKYSLPSFAEFIHDISQLRRNSVNHYIFEYEFIKFCELFYLSLYFIMKNEERFLTVFFLYVRIHILTILEKIKKELFYIKIIWNIFSFQDKIQILTIGDEKKYQSLLSFFQKFLENQNIYLSYDQISEINGVDNLMLLCLNIFVRFNLCVINNFDNFFNNFHSQKYPISEVFKDFLFYNANLTGYTFNARIELRKFMLKHNLLLETMFVNQMIIPSVFDVMNKQSNVLGLSSIY